MKIDEIFKSIQGESSYTGYPCVFIRLAGCNLDCDYCDTPQMNSFETPIEEILEKVDSLGGELVEITGGEPLLQEETVLLCQKLLDRGKKILVETNGSLDIGVIPRPAVVIMDIKTPDSLMSERMDWENIIRLEKTDEIKFVIASRKDYNWTCQKIKKYQLNERAHLLMSPVYGCLAPDELARWILEDQLNIRLQLQIHKILWEPDVKGV